MLLLWMGEMGRREEGKEGERERRGKGEKRKGREDERERVLDRVLYMR